MAKKSLRRLEEYLAKIAPENFNAALVMMGYGDLFGIAGRTLNFRTERMGVEDARKIVKIVRSYGEFSGATVARVLGMLASRIHAVEFGREYSPVLYVHYNPDYEQTVLHTLGYAKPDELDVVVSGLIRAWWD